MESRVFNTKLSFVEAMRSEQCVILGHFALCEVRRDQNGPQPMLGCGPLRALNRASLDLTVTGIEPRFTDRYALGQVPRLSTSLPRATAIS